MCVFFVSGNSFYGGGDTFCCLGSGQEVAIMALFNRNRKSKSKRASFPCLLRAKQVATVVRGVVDLLVPHLAPAPLAVPASIVLGQPISEPLSFLPWLTVCS